MKHGNGKKLGIELNNYHLHGEVLANFPNFGLISKLGPKDQCLASFLGLARQAGYSNLYLAKIRLILQNFKFWTDSNSLKNLRGQKGSCPCYHKRHLQQIHWNQIFCRMYGLSVIGSVPTSTTSRSIINKI